MKLSTVSSLCALSVCLISSAIAQDLARNFAVQGYAKYNPLGETTGGVNGPSITVKGDVQALRDAVEDNNDPLTVHVEGDFALRGRFLVGSNKSIIGTSKGANFTVGFDIRHADNVIIRNIAFGHVPQRDFIQIQNSTRVWIDHNEFNDHGEWYYGSKISIEDGSDWITVSWNYLTSFERGATVGDYPIYPSGKLTHVTFHHNHWHDVQARGPRAYHGRTHIANNLYEDFHHGAIDSYFDSQVLVEGNVFRGDTPLAVSTVRPEYDPEYISDDEVWQDGVANLGAANNWGNAVNNITRTGNFTTTPYPFQFTELDQVAEVVKAGAGRNKIS